MEDETTDILKEVTESEYKEGFYTDIETEYLPKGLNEDIIRTISEKKGEAVKEHPDLVRQYLGSDDPSWEKHEKPHRIERYFCRDIPEFIPQPGESNPERGQFPQSFTMRQPVDRRQMRGAHTPLHGHRQ